LSLHFLDWSWYLSMLSMASSLMPSIISLEYSSSSAMVYCIARRLSCLISSVSMTSSPYSSLKGVKPVVLEYCPICSLYCSIGLWMVDWGEG
jgi:hypothetical protein